MIGGETVIAALGAPVAPLAPIVEPLA
jgi:hypothetical protein